MNKFVKCTLLSGVRIGRDLALFSFFTVVLALLFSVLCSLRSGRWEIPTESSNASVVVKEARLPLVRKRA